MTKRPLTASQAKRYFEIMIISTGVDLAEVDRIQAALEDPRIGRRFRDRVFTEKEIAYCEKKKLRGKYESYAGRFAAKEAVMKALGRGWGAKVRWLDIEVARARSGKPDIALNDKTAQLAAAHIQFGIGRLAGDLFGDPAACHELQYLDLARGQIDAVAR